MTPTMMLWLLGGLVFTGVCLMVAWFVIWWRQTSIRMRGASWWQRL